MSDAGALVITYQGYKGGIGKTTLTINTAVAFAIAGYKVLVCDQDPQGSSTEVFKVYEDHDGNLDRLRKEDIVGLGLYNLYLTDTDIKKYIKKTKYENNDIIPNARNVLVDTPFDTVFDTHAASAEEKYLAFYRNLCQARKDYDYIIIDGQPSWGRMTDILLLASDYVICPILPDIYSFSPVSDIMAKIAMLNMKYNRNVVFAGYVFNQVTGKGEKEILNAYRNSFPELEFDTYIRYSASVKSSSARGLSFFEYEKFKPTSNAGKDIINFLINGLAGIDEEHEKELNKNLSEGNFGRRKGFEEE